MDALPSTSLEIRSLVKASGELELGLAELPIPEPAADEVLVRVEASPINPSDQGLLLAGADLSNARVSGTAQRPVVSFPIPPQQMRALAGRVGQSMPVGNEGAGTVVRAGGSTQAQSLLGRRVAVFGGGLYAQYRAVTVSRCLALPDGVTAAQGAAAFVNPLTALGMVETTRREGHRALVHAPAASNLGQMLVRICREDGIGLVNLVRSETQRELLAGLGATHVCNTASPAFHDDLVAALADTGATIAFDAIGGGTLASDLLQAMETVALRSTSAYSRYGSGRRKQVYVYGHLDPSPTILDRRFGMTWSVGGWLLWPFLQSIGGDAEARLRQRVLDGLTTTFASSYAAAIGLAQALAPATIARYARRGTGEKLLIAPNEGF